MVMLSSNVVSADEVIAVARHDEKIEISKERLDAVATSRAFVDAIAESGEAIYGISTGFGALASQSIPPALREQLQHSLIRSHAAGMGPVVEREVVRALMFLRLKTISTGNSGVRPLVVETMAAILNAGITPIVYEYGSLGCSGDLAPLAHCALTLLGEGEVLLRDGTQVTAKEGLAKAGIAPITLREKEGLALINGTDGMLGMLLLAIADLTKLCKVADIATAMSAEALLGTDRVFGPDLHGPLRPHPGQAASAANIYALMSGSKIVESHRFNDDLVQDAYSLRCAPQVAGAVRDTIAHARTIAERELAATIDNPIVLSDGRVESNGNFHGAPVGYVLDFLAIAAADLGSISERRTDRMLDPKRSNGLPAFLADDPGVDSGLMIAQYTQAALVSESKRLAVPASVDSIPSSAMQEDHVSMGWSAARKLRQSIANLERILAIEVLTAARALQLRSPLQPAAGTRAVSEALGSHAAPGPDRYLSPDLEAVRGLVASGRVIEAASKVVGDLL
jgi:histidine ammonia-lyase